MLAAPPPRVAAMNPISRRLLILGFCSLLAACGTEDPVADGIDTIAVPDFNVELLGHSVFAKAEALLYDIGGLMRSCVPVRFGSDVGVSMTRNVFN